MNKIGRKAVRMFRTVNHCLASAEVYLSMAPRRR